MSNGKTVSWHQAAAWPLVIISGPETYFASRAIRQIKNQLRVEHEALEVSEVAEGEYSPGLLFSLAAPSLFNEPRLVVIQSASEGLLEDIQSLMSDPAQNCTIVIRTPNLVGQNGKVKKELASLALNISCDEVKKDSDRIDFINREFKTFGIPIDQPAVKALAAAFGSDMGELGAACDQLAKSGKAKVTASDVEQSFEGRQETNAFKIADAALAGNATEAIRLFRHGSATGIDPVALTAALAMKIRQLARLFNDRNATPAALGMAPWQVDKARRELNGWSEAELIELVQLSAKTDFDTKGASRDPQYSIEKLLLKMARAG
ncbi:DNA polymerase III subunit delta [Aquiluna sp.]|nr:DNA polymerase III subunit delta [Aquiluna sp.]MDB4254412.1 DNA polymerase III subunit delta [Aquiluna sp.]